MKLWKGLFYCMWMSDKPLIQEDLAETISGLVHSIVDRKTALKFISISLKVIAKDWSGIDTWRMDKFLMVRFQMFFHFQSIFAHALVVIVCSKDNSTQFRVPGKRRLERGRSRSLL